ncbi:MAG TPA: DUF167 domain-containing protein [Anaerolineae bacterium]|nr:DUF167 domain-containing protein [Anaerolineae bacterium]
MNAFYLKVRVIPRSQKTEVVNILADGTLKIKLKSPPIEGRANKELIKVLSKILCISSNRIRIKTGRSSKNKLLIIEGVDKKATIAKLRNNSNYPP